ncbi:hypothetical protein [Candidatus Methylocalor cossyra]|uniref:Uncharacterized protein n=1 Tax=Candidatus Methylocalor cossyra TaxID=3108543 RepID=A0ABP1C6U2_9GAMM
MATMIKGWAPVFWGTWLLLSSKADALALMPSAATASDFTITVDLLAGAAAERSASDRHSLGREGVVLVTPPTSVQAATTVALVGYSSLFDASGDGGFAGHQARAAAALQVAPLSSRPASGPVPLVALHSTTATAAAAATPQPLFAKALAYSQGVASGITLHPSPAPGTEAFDPSLAVTWHVDQLALDSSPHTAFAYLRDTVEIVQQGAHGIHHATVGFTVAFDNGRPLFSYLEAPGDNGIRAWFGEYVQAREQAIAVLPNAPGIDLTLPVPGPLDGTQLAIRYTHLELAQEAPPRAVIQTGAAAGFTPGHSGPAPEAHWNPATGTLTFDSIPLTTFTEPGSAGDPLHGGSLEIGPFRMLGTVDGRTYFEGDTLSLWGRDGTLVLRASLPTLVFENALKPLQGFDLFAPLLYVMEAEPGISPWLDAFLQAYRPELPAIPELFIGLEPSFTTPAPWTSHFDVPVTALLSYAGAPKATSPRGQIPAPGTLALLLPFLWRLRLAGKPRRCAGATPRALRHGSSRAGRRFAPGNGYEGNPIK